MTKLLAKSLGEIALRAPVLNVAALRAFEAAVRLGSGWLRAHPERYLTLYRAARFMYRRLGLSRERGNEGAAGRAWERLDARLENLIHVFLREENDPGLVRRINRDLASLDCHERVERCKGFPFRANIDLTSVCNLCCPMCTQHTLSASLTRLFLDVGHLDRIEPALRYLEHVSLVGLGETFCHPDFREFISRIKREGVAVRIITNGILIPEETARFLVASGLDELWISLDATQAETYRLIRGVNKFEQVLENLRRLNAIKRETGRSRPSLRLNFVAMRSNIAQLPGFIRLAKELDAEAVNACYLMVHSETMRSESLFYDRPAANRCVLEARVEAQKLGLEFNDPGLFALEEKNAGPNAAPACETPAAVVEGAVPPGLGYRWCREPWEFVLFNCEGKVMPCCVEQARLGDLRATPFEAIWNGKDYRDYRLSLRTEHPSVFCQGCMMVGLRDINKPEGHFRLIFEEMEKKQRDRSETSAP